MKQRALFFLLALGVAGCADDAITQDDMVIDPHNVVLSSAAMSSHISITHTCTCPFSWSATVTPSSPWLTFPSTMSGDNPNVPISIDTAKLSQDTSRAMIVIQSTGDRYGSDTIQVTAVR